MPSDISSWVFTNSPSNWSTSSGGWSGNPWGVRGTGGGTGTGGGYGGGGGGGYAPGTLPGAPGTGGSGTPYGRVPQVPDPAAVLRSSIRANLGAFGDIEGLARRTNTLSTDEMQRALETSLPGYADTVSSAMGNIASNLRGEIDPGVLGLFQQDAAERGIGTGLSGSPNIDSNYLTNVLRNRLALQAQGQNQLNARVGATPLAPQFNPSSFFVTPAQQFQAQTAANIAAAAPDPAAAAAAARDALNAGARFGAGIGGGGGSGAYRMPSFGGLYGANTPTSPGVVVGQSPAGGSVIGGVEYPAGTTPSDISTQDWYSSINWTPPPQEYMGPSAYSYSGGTPMADVGVEEGWWDPYYGYMG